MFNKKIDIIMPNYNKSIFLKEAQIQFNPKHIKIEIIYVDDNSSDNSSKILKSYIKKD